MLAHILAVLVGTGSVGLYIAAFFFPEIHRKHDFIWSGVGFFYALALWIYARQTTGGILVGQAASVALIGWFAWQTLKLRRQLVPANQQTPIPTTTQIQQQLGLKPIGGKPTKSAKSSTNKPSTTTTVPTPKPANPTPPAAPTTQAPVVQPVVDAAAQRKDRAAVPGKADVPKAPPVAPARIQAPVVPPVVEATAQTKDPAVASPQVDVPIVPEQQTQPSRVPPVPHQSDEAWIELEIKPAPTTTIKPLGQPVKPPTAPPEPPQLPAITAESISRNVPTDTIKTNVRLDNVEHPDVED